MCGREKAKMSYQTSPLALIPFDKEPLLPVPGVVGERTVSETRTARIEPRLIHDVHDPAGVQPPQAEIPGNDRHGIAWLDRRLG